MRKKAIGGKAIREDPIYLDYAATAPLDPRVKAVLDPYLGSSGLVGNPSSIHIAGRQAAAATSKAREQLAAMLKCSPAELIWTSGATESDNLAILGAARNRAHRGKHLVTMPTEHKAVVDTFKALEKEGFDVTWMEPDSDGLLQPATLEAALRTDTQLVSVMHVNNETGVIQDITQIGDICRERDVLFHSDAAQSAGKLPIDLGAQPIDLMSLTAHKFHGPQGIGALYIANRPGCNLNPIMFGGGQERRLRPGTLPLHLVVGCGAAAEIATHNMQDDLKHVRRLNAALLQGLAGIPNVWRNGHPGHLDHHYPGIVNVCVDGVEGESLMLALEPVCVASGSACNATSGEPSYVLRALGRSDEQAQSALRFSFGRGTTDADITDAIERLEWATTHLRNIAPATRPAA